MPFVDNVPPTVGNILTGTNLKDELKQEMLLLPEGQEKRPVQSVPNYGLGLMFPPAVSQSIQMEGPETQAHDASLDINFAVRPCPVSLCVVIDFVFYIDLLLHFDYYIYSFKIYLVMVDVSFDAIGGTGIAFLGVLFKRKMEIFCLDHAICKLQPMLELVDMAWFNLDRLYGCCMALVDGGLC